MEALVENSSGPPSRFYCHSCTIEIDRVSSDFTCPHCFEGFIEELPPVDPANLPPPPAPEDDVPMHAMPMRLVDEIFNNPLLSMLSSQHPQADEAGSSEADEMSSAGAGSGRRGRNRRRGFQNIHNLNLDNILREILISVADGANGGAGGTPMFFMGNPGDYAWGREGLDTIVTQLLNQMDNTGPPPLEKEKIAEIPKVSITQEQVDIKLQCSVCWEDFKIEECVRKLSCTHLYHETCIIPWLELHGTCPICRKSLVPEQPDEQRSLSAAATAVANTLRSFQQDTFPSGGQSSSSGDEGPSTFSQQIPEFFNSDRPMVEITPRETQTQTQQQPQNRGNNSNSSNSDRLRDDDGNIDFDFD